MQQVGGLMKSILQHAKLWRLDSLHDMSTIKERCFLQKTLK